MLADPPNANHTAEPSVRIHMTISMPRFAGDTVDNSIFANMVDVLVEPVCPTSRFPRCTSGKSPFADAIQELAYDFDFEEVVLHVFCGRPSFSHLGRKPDDDDEHVDLFVDDRDDIVQYRSIHLY